MWANFSHLPKQAGIPCEKVSFMTTPDVLCGGRGYSPTKVWWQFVSSDSPTQVWWQYCIHQLCLRWSPSASHPPAQVVVW